jgi:general secretion pathway protein M|nr:type II secretion system protein GspM [uncultured Rhodoferax sp.]
MNRPTQTGLTALLAPLQTRWSQLAAREKNFLAAALVLVVLAVVWKLVLSPSLHTLRTSNAQATALDAQIQHMLSLQNQASALQRQAPLTYDEALRALNLATRQTLAATAQVNVVADRANVTLQAASADALAQWLAQARLNARSVPLEARLTRGTNPTGATWSGTLVMSLPPR